LPAFYVLITYILGVQVGIRISPDIPMQTVIICITLICLFKTIHPKTRFVKVMILIAIFNAGMVRASLPSFNIFPIEWYEHLRILIQPFKARLIEAMGTGLTESQKELIGGIVLGRGSGVTDIKSWPHFLKSGMSHLLVASGAQVSLSIFPLILLADHVNMSIRARKLIYTIAATLLFLLLLIVGLEPSILRAVTSCYMFLLARTINRKCQSLNIIYATALLWLWINPSLIRNIGFQLSYSASWGLIYIYPRLRLLLMPGIASKPENLKRKITRRIYIFSIEIILLMLAAQGAVMPVLSHHFHRFSFSGFIANIIAIPLSGLIMYMGMAAALTGQISTPLAGLINIINGFLLNTLNLTALLFSSIPYIPSPSNGMLGLLMPYIFMVLFFEARFKPYGLIKALDVAQKILYPLDNLKNIKPFWRFRLID